MELQEAKILDQNDELRIFREHFYVPDDGLIYVDGNSLGKPPKSAIALADQLMKNAWGDRLIRSWEEGWIDIPELIGNKIGKLIGAQEGEVIVADSTSVNLFKLFMAALGYQSGRSKVITDDQNFPSDLYVLDGVVDLLGNNHRIEIISSHDGIHGPTDDIINAIDRDTALVTLSHTLFKSAYVYDLEKITKAAHQFGALVLWDLSHSVGVMSVDLGKANADLAVGSTYKYLSGGPGSPAFIYIAKDLQGELNNPITGWMGKNNMFDFDLKYQRDPTLRHFLTGTSPIISAALIEPGVDLILQAGIENIRSKSVLQTEYLIKLWREDLSDLGYQLGSPLNASQRGSHVSLTHPEGLRIGMALRNEMSIIPDFRPPDHLRIGIAPLYTTFEDVFATAAALKTIVEQKIYEKYSKEAPRVT